MLDHCLNCGNSVTEQASFCTNCGADLRDGGRSSSQPAPETDSGGVSLDPDQGLGTSGPAGELGQLQATVAALRAELSGIAQRVYLIEQMVSAPGAQSTQTQTARDQAEATSASSSSPAAPSYRPVPPAGAGGDAAARPAPEGSSAPPGAGWLNTVAGWNWEWLLGGNWLARIGAVALVLGAGFFLKLAIDNNWIGEIGQVFLGLVAGLALIGGGEYWQKKYPILAQPLTGAGIAVLYLSVFAAFALYDLLPPLPAFGLFFLITLAAAALALRYESMPIAVIGIFGGFLTPLLLNERLPDQRLLLAYVLVLDLGVLALATFRNWRWFTLLSLAGSLVLYGFWQAEFNPGPLLGQVGITLIFLIFVAATTLFHIIWRRAAGPLDQALMVVNAAAYFGISYGLLFDDFRPWMGGFTVLLALFYGVLGYAVLKRSGEQVYLSLFALGTGLVFVTIAVPVQLGGPWISVAWATEGLVLIWLASYLKMHQLRWFGVGVFAIFAAWLFFRDTPRALNADLRPFWNVYLPAYLASVAITYLAAYLLNRQKDSLLPWGQALFPAFLVAANLFLTLGLATQVPGHWIALTWTGEALVLMAVSLRLGLIELRLFSLGLLAIVGVRLLAFDTFNFDSETFRPIINLRFLSFSVGIAGMYLAALMLWRWGDRQPHSWWVPLSRFIWPSLLAVASFLTLWILSAEIITTVESGFVSVPRNYQDDLVSLVLSLLWAVYAGGLLVLGMVKRWTRVRQAGLALMAIPVIKLFVFDVFALEQEYRVAAFLGLGALLVAGGYLYQRHTSAIRGFLFE